MTRLSSFNLCLLFRLFMHVDALPAADVLFVLLDDFGYNDIGYHNQGKGPGRTLTPHMDALAKTGVKLEQYYTNPICSPTRATIMTGRYTIRTGIQHSCYSPTKGVGLPLREQTMAQVFSKSGYETWMFGKWHLGFKNVSYTPQARGFDRFFGHYNAEVSAYNHTFGAGPDGLDWHRAMSSNPGEDGYLDQQGIHTTSLIVKEFEDLMANRDSATGTLKPLFAYVAFHMVHESDGVDSQGQDPLSTCAKGKCLEAPSSYVKPFSKWTDVDKARHTFLGMVAIVDEAVGQITRRWQQRRPSGDAHEANGIIVVTSDNGSPPDLRGTNGNLPLRGHKHQLWEGGVRVPAFISGEGSTSLPKDATSNALWHASDWLPTLTVAAASADPEEDSAGPLDGMNQWPTLLRPGGGSLRKEMLHNIDTSSKPTSGFVAAFRMANGLKLVQLKGEPTPQLYNVTADPQESQDLAGQKEYEEDLKLMQQKVSALHAQAVPCWGGTGVAPPSADCDSVPNLPCQKPHVWRAGWCDQGPSPAPPPGITCAKPSNSFCEHNVTACGSGKTDIHKGKEDVDDCRAKCLTLPGCNCFDIAPHSKNAPCKLYSGTTSLKVKDGLTTYVRGTNGATFV